MQITRYSRQILMTLNFSRHIFEESPNVKFHGNPSSGGRTVPYGQRDMTKQIVVSRNEARALKKDMYFFIDAAVMTATASIPRTGGT